MKYIDADKLREKIEFSKFVYSNPKRVVHGVADAFEQDGRAAMCDDILKKLDSLQQDHLPAAGKMVESEHIADVSKMIEKAVQLVFDEKLTPFKDGNQWCFLLGHNIQDGVCGFGDTILDAAVDFYRDYESTKFNIVELKISLEQPEVELEEEVINYFEGYWPGMETAAQCNTQMRFTPPAIMRLVRHFYGLGLKAGKEK